MIELFALMNVSGTSWWISLSVFSTVMMKYLSLDIFLKKRCLFSSQFWILKDQSQSTRPGLLPYSLTIGH